MHLSRLVLAAALLAGCGGEAAGSPDPLLPCPAEARVLNDAERWEWERMQFCTERQSPEPMILRVPTVECETGVECCITPQRGGEYRYDCGGLLVVAESCELPTTVYNPLGHEMAHHLFYYTEGDADPGHARPEWACQFN